MRKNNSKNTLKTITIAAAVTIFGIGAIFAVKAAGSANSDNASAKTVVAAANTQEEETLAIDTTNTETVNETTTVTVAQTEEATQTTEAQTEEATQATEAQTEAQTETQAQVVEVAAVEATPVDARVQEVITRINAERAAAGVAPVAYDPVLNQMAQKRAEEEITVAEANGKLMHNRPDGSKASTICYEFERYGNFGEVLGRFQSTPEEIVLGWHNSPAHYNCMVNGVYTQVGVGIATDSLGRIYWSAIFMN